VTPASQPSIGLSVVLVFLLATAFLGDLFTWKGAVGATLVVAGSILLT
jgi:uncharacterized membrane protein